MPRECKTLFYGATTRICRHAALVAATVLSSLIVIAPPAAQAADAPRKSYKLDSVELRGTKRVSSEQLQHTLRIKPNDDLSDDYVSELRARLLSLGLFKDALFSLQKGSLPGTAKLIISVSDDDSVMGREALGGDFGLLISEPERAIGNDSPFRAYRFGLIARNLFGSMHRAAINADMDAKGTITSGSAAYGLPRFAAEGVQFDGGIGVSDPTSRYLETQAFGMKIQTLWTRSQRWWDLQYGAAWYSNTHTRYRLNGWPEVSAGPKFGLTHETRFMGFLPSEGWRAAVDLIPSLVKREEAISEWQLAGTWVPFRLLACTADLQATTVGRTGVTTRGELRLDVPITNSSSEGTKALTFIKLRQGQDRYKESAFVGSDAVLGIRYHSSGFIGELSFQVTQRNPLSTPVSPVSNQPSSSP